MKTSRFHCRLAAVAFLTAFAAAALAQDFGGPGGPPPGGPQGGPGGMRMGPPPALDRLPPLARLLGQPGVAEELNLTDDQYEGIEAIARSLGGRRMGPPPGGPGGPDGGGPPPPPQGGQRGPGGPEDRAAREKAEAEADAKIRAILTSVQAKRAAELQIQTMGLTAAMVPAVQAKLGLSDDQKAKLKALVPAPGQGRPEGGPRGGGFGQGGPGAGGPPPDGQGGPGGFGGPPPGGPGGQRGPGGFGQGGPGGGGRGRGPGGGPNDPRRRELETKIAAILTDAQEATLKALGGKPMPRPGENRPPEG